MASRPCSPACIVARAHHTGNLVPAGADLHRPLREAWIVDAVRTPIGRYGGALASVRPDDLAARVLRAIVKRTGLGPVVVEDVILGRANQAGEDTATWRAPYVMLKAESAFERGTHELVDSTLGWRFVNPKLDAAYPAISLGDIAECSGSLSPLRPTPRAGGC